MSKRGDNWETPQWLFDELNKEFNFEWDLCCNKNNCKLGLQQTQHISSLYNIFNPQDSWSTYWDLLPVERIFCNPPYSNPYPFIKYCKDLIDERLVSVCVLVVPSCTETKWWGIFWDYEKHKPKPGVEVRFLPKRVAFVDPDTGKEVKGNTKGTAIVIMRPNDLT